MGSAPPGMVGGPGSSPPRDRTTEGSASRGKEEFWAGKDRINWVTPSFAEVEGSSPWHGKGGRRGPGLPPGAYLLSAPVLTSIPARSGKRKVGGRKTCRDERTFSYCTSASRKSARGCWDGCAESGDLHPGFSSAGSSPAPWQVRGAAGAWGGLGISRCGGMDRAGWRNWAPLPPATGSGPSPGRLTHLSVPLVAMGPPATGRPREGRTGPCPPALPGAKEGRGSLPLPVCHVGVPAGREQSLHSQPDLEPNANKSIARVLETYFPMFYLGFHCLCTCVNGANSSSIDTG